MTIGRKMTLPAARWSPHAWLCIVIASVAALAADTVADSADLLRALDSIVLEEDARTILEPHTQDLRKLPAAVIEKVIFKQWWNIATEMIARSHTQHTDLSFSVRKAVRSLKDEADELLRTLNPKYGQAQQVAPAFQWAQNDTCIFLTVKFTVRWNAPGALEVTEPQVHMEGNKFNFTGLGKHSNNKYSYLLALKFFDNISPENSVWSTSSVGKLGVTLRKKWARKWPRLLQDKKMKIGNMHVWMETQDRISGQLSGLSTVSNSPITCREVKKLYCSVTDTCKIQANCSQCPGKTEPEPGAHICAGVPTQKGNIVFKDADMDQYKLGGVIKVSREPHDYESDSFAVYWGQDDRKKLEIDGQAALIREAPVNGQGEASINLEFGTKQPDQASHILMFTKNAYGEHSTPNSVFVKDAYMPSQIPKRIIFDDEDGDRNEIKGDITVEKPDDQSTVEKYSIYWGKSATHKIDKRRKNDTAAFLADLSSDATSHYVEDSTKIPASATHLLVYSKNEFGENPTPVALRLVDNLKPCQRREDEDCPTGVSVKHLQEDSNSPLYHLSVQRAKSEAGLAAYTLYWGRSSCEEGGESARNGQIKYFAVEDIIEYVVPPGTEVPDGTTHILAFSQNRLGESKFCVSESLPSNTAGDATGKPEL